MANPLDALYPPVTGGVRKKSKMDEHLESLGPVDGAQVVIDTTTPALAARNAVQAASGVKVVGTSLLKKAPIISAPFLAYEAAQNTSGGWGNAIAKQDQAISGDYGAAVVEGLANPLTSIANAASKAPGAVQAVHSIATAPTDEEIRQNALAHRASIIKQQQANAVRERMKEQLIKQSMFRTDPAPQPAAPAPLFTGFLNRSR